MQLMLSRAIDQFGGRPPIIDPIEHMHIRSSALLRRIAAIEIAEKKMDEARVKATCAAGVAARSHNPDAEHDRAVASADEAYRRCWRRRRLRAALADLTRQELSTCRPSTSANFGEFRPDGPSSLAPMSRLLRSLDYVDEKGVLQAPS